MIARKDYVRSHFISQNVWSINDVMVWKFLSDEVLLFAGSATSKVDLLGELRIFTQ